MDILIRKIIFWVIIASLAIFLFFYLAPRWLKNTEERLDKFSQMKYTSLIRSIDLEI